MRRIAGAAALVGAMLALSGCAGAGACGTMHRGDGFPVVVSGALAPHPTLQLCVAGACTGRILDRNDAYALVGSGGTLLRVSRITPGRWYVAVERGADPASVTVALGSDPAQAVPLSWHRAPGSDSCVSWRTVDDVRLALG